jgi:gliding motility-associated-like protein
MDLDVYDIQDNIAVGDTSALIELTSARDFVMINTVITKLNSELPDATIVIDKAELKCNTRNVKIEFTVYNVNSTNFLQANVPIAVFINGQFFQYFQTLGQIPIDGNQSQSISFVLPDEINTDFEVTLVVDSNDIKVGSIKEINEDNNEVLTRISIPILPKYNLLENLTACNEGLKKGAFDFSNYENTAKVEITDKVTFFETFDDADANVNPILNISNLKVTTPYPVFVRIENLAGCFSITSFELITKNCPPKVYNLVATNPDGFYDSFLVDGLRDVFINFKTEIYNRWGNLVWIGNNNTEDWKGTSNQGTNLLGNELSEGTYFYIINLNDLEYPNPLTGYIHLTK